MPGVPLGLVFLYTMQLATADMDTCTYSDVKCDRSVDIAIVGAGIAGTYFAYKVRDAGLDIELLEYSDRIGGRLFTTSLPNIPDINLEMGGMRFIEGEHARVQHLLHELRLTPQEFITGYGGSEESKYFVRGKLITLRELLNGDVPYNLSIEERANAGKIGCYFYKQLLGVTGGITDDEALTFRTKNGIEMAKLTVDEALDIVATPDGKQFMKDVSPFKSAFCKHCNAAEHFLDHQHMISYDNCSIPCYR